MIISKIVGGLGNQMFQYAAGRALALRNDCRLLLDISHISRSSGYAFHQGYELVLFNINADLAKPRDISNLTGSGSKLLTNLRKKIKLTKRTHIIESNFFFDQKIFNCQQPAYLEGYWQSFKYFEPFSRQIKSELTIKNPLSERNFETAKRIENCNSVSIHVRRGDYVTNSTYAKVHNFVGIDYYKKAIEHITDRVSSPFFFVFSDDLIWAKSNLNLGGNAAFISHNTGASSYEDMRLMSLCKHNIIANSTFSWWAAWLNSNCDGVIVAPSAWLGDKGVVSDYEKFMNDLIPSTWERR